jgi:hypothetical protein
MRAKPVVPEATVKASADAICTGVSSSIINPLQTRRILRHLGAPLALPKYPKGILLNF